MQNIKYVVLEGYLHDFQEPLFSVIRIEYPSPPPLSEDLEKCLQALHTGDRVRATGRPGDGNLRLSGLEIVDRGGGAP